MFVGILLSLNFVLFWAVPIAGMGSLWKYALKKYLLPIYNLIDQHKNLRAFAVRNIYTKAQHADFFAISVLIVLNSVLSVGVLFYWQLSTGALPMWLVFIYYCAWVGVGGRIMGAAYALAHKEVNSLQTFYFSFSLNNSYPFNYRTDNRF